MNQGTSRSTSAARTYLHQMVMTASDVKLVVLLYDHGLNQMEVAMKAVGEGEVARASEAFSKAFATVSELRTSLNKEEGGQIAVDLDRLYDFVQDRLISANRERKVEPIEEALGVMRTLKEGWDGLLRTS